MKPLVTMREALADPDLFGTILAGDTWAAWRVVLIASMGEALTRDERALFEALTGRPQEPGEMVEELWGIVGRRGGKTRAIAVLGAYLAALCDHAGVLAPGERGSLPIMSASMAQAQKCFSYVLGIFTEVPLFAREVERQTSDTIGLATRIDIEVRPASYRTIRGSTAVAAIGDEVAFWLGDYSSANPDSEILNAVRPALATTGGPLICISSPYARRGEMWNAFRRYYGAAGDPRILVAKGPSRTFNPGLSQKVVDRAIERDAASASAEYLAEFRTDVEAFLSRDVIDKAIVGNRHELPPESGKRYVAFVDPSGGSADSFTLAIAYLDGGCAILAAVRERRPPFSPDGVVTEFAELLKAYRITEVTGDRYGGDWPRERFRVAGIGYRPSERSKSEIYSVFLPLMNSGRAELLENERLANQLCSLERRTARGGRDSIDHPPGGHDDLANAAAGAVVLAADARGPIVIPDAALVRSRTRFLHI